MNRNRNIRSNLDNSYTPRQNYLNDESNERNFKLNTRSRNNFNSFNNRINNRDTREVRDTRDTKEFTRDTKDYDNDNFRDSRDTLRDTREPTRDLRDTLRSRDTMETRDRDIRNVKRDYDTITYQNSKDSTQFNYSNRINTPRDTRDTVRDVRDSKEFTRDRDTVDTRDSKEYIRDTKEFTRDTPRDTLRETMDTRDNLDTRDREVRDTRDTRDTMDRDTRDYDDNFRDTPRDVRDTRDTRDTMDTRYDRIGPYERRNQTYPSNNGNLRNSGPIRKSNITYNRYQNNRYNPNFNPNNRYNPNYNPNNRYNPNYNPNNRYNPNYNQNNRFNPNYQNNRYNPNYQNNRYNPNYQNNRNDPNNRYDTRYDNRYTDSRNDTRYTDRNERYDTRDIRDTRDYTMDMRDNMDTRDDRRYTDNRYDNRYSNDNRYTDRNDPNDRYDNRYTDRSDPNNRYPNDRYDNRYTNDTRYTNDNRYTDRTDRTERYERTDRTERYERTDRYDHNDTRYDRNDMELRNMEDINVLRNKERIHRTKIFIGNLSGDVTQEELTDKFSSFGPINRIDFRRKFAFIDYVRSKDADAAIRDMHNKFIWGSYLKVQPHIDQNKRLSSRDPKPSFQITVSNLDQSVSWQDLKDFGRQAGDVHYTSIIIKGDKRFGLIEYTNEQSVQKAMNELNGQKIVDNILELTHIPMSEFFKKLGYNDSIESHIIDDDIQLNENDVFEAENSKSPSIEIKDDIYQQGNLESIDYN